jgi:uncharacterized membrane protein YtjA (UPF0391 family)
LAADLTGLSVRSRGGFCSSGHGFLRGFRGRNRREPSFPSRIISAVDAALFYRADARTERGKRRFNVMLSWVVTFLIIALIAGILGFGGIAGASIEIAKVIFFIAVILFLVSAVVGLARGRTRV